MKAEPLGRLKPIVGDHPHSNQNPKLRGIEAQSCDMAWLQSL
jgi:hypothetical protein